MIDRPHRRPVGEIARGVTGGGPSAVDVARAALDDIAAASALHAFLAVDPGGALDAARRVDAHVGTGALAGVPVAVKDNICTLGLPTTCGSRILEGYVSPFEATAVARLRAAGAVIVGKTNMDEFAMGSSTENSAYGPTRNPHDPARVPGGSSGGSAAAVAAGLVPAALGTETGGSVRQPAAYCGIVGIKPSYGRVSRYGQVAFASSLDQIGTFGRTVRDAALLLRTIAGHDPLDSTTSTRPVPDLLEAAERGELVGRVVGVPEEYFPPDLDPGIAEACRDAIAKIESLGATLRPVSLPHTRHAIPTYYVIAPAEASSNLARFDGVRYGMRAPETGSVRALHEETRSQGFGAEVKRRIMIGTYALCAGWYDQYYARAQCVRRLLALDVERVFASGVDLLFTPTTPTPAFRLGERAGRPYSMYLSDVFTVTASLVGLPALSLPIGSVDGLPVGGQLIARRWDEAGLVGAAAALEEAFR